MLRKSKMNQGFEKDKAKEPRTSDSGGRDPSGGPDLPIVSTKQLFGDQREIGIDHEGSLYRLKITRHGKLILNK